MSTLERTTILEQAHLLDEEFSPQTEQQYVGPGAYEGVADKALACAIDIIDGHDVADESGGSTEHGLYGARVERWVLWTDGQGFHYLTEYDDAVLASQALVREIEEQDAEEERHGRNLLGLGRKETPTP